MQQLRLANTALPLALLVALSAGCDRRNAEPIEPADSATTIVDDSPVAATATNGTAPTANTGPGKTESCSGLTGDAEADCLARNDGTPPASAPADPEEQTETSADNPLN